MRAFFEPSSFDAPTTSVWFSVTGMAARMIGERESPGSHDAAREIYRHLSESSNDKAIKEMVTHQIMRLDWLDDRDMIRNALNDYRSRSGRCPSLWREVAGNFRGTRLRIEATTGVPLDPSGIPYRLINNGCDVDLDEKSKVPRR